MSYQAPKTFWKNFETYWGDIRDIKTHLDVTISTIATESTLSDIKSKTDNLDVLLSTRASEATLSSIKNALASVGTDKLRTSVVDSLPESPFNITKVAGTALTGRDWSSDFAKLQNLDVALTALSKLIRWGRDVSPTWVHGSEVTAPAANVAPLVLHSLQQITV
jgi:hypothetical protein